VFTRWTSSQLQPEHPSTSVVPTGVGLPPLRMSMVFLIAARTHFVNRYSINRHSLITLLFHLQPGEERCDVLGASFDRSTSSRQAAPLGSRLKAPEGRSGCHVVFLRCLRYRPTTPHTKHQYSIFGVRYSLFTEPLPLGRCVAPTRSIHVRCHAPYM
jgi:hypothetical protein